MNLSTGLLCFIVNKKIYNNFVWSDDFISDKSYLRVWILSNGYCLSIQKNTFVIMFACDNYILN